MNKFVLIVKGFFIGIANIIPGVSGGTLAITLGIYDKLIGIISHFFRNILGNIKYLFPIILGAIIAILLGSKFISFCLDKYLFVTILFFVGAILGGVPMLEKKLKGHYKEFSNIFIFLCSFILVILLTFLAGGSDVSFDSINFKTIIMLFIVGIIASATMIIPGISGSAVLMTLGYYEPILSIVKNLTDFSNLSFNMSILIPFGIGIIFGIFLIAKLIEFLLKKYEVKTFFGIMGFVLSSVISIIIQNFFMGNVLIISGLSIVFGIILFLIGFVIAYFLGDK